MTALSDRLQVWDARRWTIGVAPLLLLRSYPQVFMIRSHLLALASSLFLVTSPAWSQVPDETQSAPARTPAPPPSDETKVELPAKGTPTADDSEAEKGSTNYEERRRQALVAYNVGDVDSALADLRALVTTCDEDGPAICPDPTRAKLYVALGIVLAGGKNDIQGAARLFHAALTRDPSVTIPRELATRPVQEAMREANESTSYRELSAPAPSPEESPEKVNAPPLTDEPPPDDDDDDADDEVESHDRKTRIILLHALLGTGADDISDAPTFGAAGVIGARFVDSSAWTTAIRARVAAVGANQDAVGGAALLMGGSWYGHRHKRMGYFLGGIGIDSYGGQGGVSVNGMGGVTLGGFLLGGGVDLGASDYGSFAMMCLHLGWGARL